jgi:hypothetical protein
MGIGKAQTVRRRRDENRISPPVQTRLQFADHFHFAFCILHFAFKLPAILSGNHRQKRPLRDPLLRVNLSQFEPIRVSLTSRSPRGRPPTPFLLSFCVLSHSFAAIKRLVLQ